MKSSFNVKINNVTITNAECRANIGNIEVPITFECDADETEVMYKGIASYAKELMSVIAAVIPSNNVSFANITFGPEVKDADEVSDDVMKAAEETKEEE